MNNVSTNRRLLEMFLAITHGGYSIIVWLSIVPCNRVLHTVCPVQDATRYGRSTTQPLRQRIHHIALICATCGCRSERTIILNRSVVAPTDTHIHTTVVNRYVTTQHNTTHHKTTQHKTCANVVFDQCNP